MSDSEFIRHIPCPECGSSDANSIYTDGHEFCHKCNYYKPADGTATNHTHHRVQNVRLQGSAGRLHSRGITEKTCELFKTYRDGELLRHYYFDGAGSPVGAKVRTPKKDFRCEGEVKTLFGMQNYRHKTSNKTQKLVITEGEMDAMSVWEAQPHWDVSPYLMELPRPRKLFKTTTNGSSTTTRLSSSSITMKRATKALRKLPV